MVKRPTPRATTIRWSVRNGIVCAASTTARSSYSSPSNSSTIRLRSPSPTSWWTRSCAFDRRIDSSSPVSRWTPMATPIHSSDRRHGDNEHRPIPSTSPCHRARARAPSAATVSTQRTPMRHGNITTGCERRDAPPRPRPAGSPYSMTNPATGTASRLAGTLTSGNRPNTRPPESPRRSGRRA